MAVYQISQISGIVGTYVRRNICIVEARQLKYVYISLRHNGAQQIDMVNPVLDCSTQFIYNRISGKIYKSYAGQPDVFTESRLCR